LNFKIKDILVLGSKRIALVSNTSISVIDFLSKKLLKEIQYSGKYISLKLVENLIVLHLSKSVTIYETVKFEILDHLDESNKIKSYLLDVGSNILF